jgi:AcrR family transcriptional regulator
MAEPTTRTRTRRTPDEARRQILDAAEELLIEGGPAAVQVRAVARRIGVTDAAVNHHVGTRDELLVALLRHGARRLRDALSGVCERWAAGGGDSRELVDALARVYQGGYAELAVALRLAGWRPHGSGLLSGVVDVLHERRVVNARRAGRPAPPRRDTQLAVAALNQALVAEPLFGAQVRAGVGIPARLAASDGGQRRWWANVLDRLVDGDDTVRGRPAR